MEINFIYQEKDHKVECSEADLIKDVREKFAKENNLDLDVIYFVYKGEKINFNLGLFVQKLYDLKNNSNEEQKRMDIYINEEPPFYIKFLYKQKNKIMKVKITDKIKDAFKKFADETLIDLTKIYFVYHAKTYFYDQIEDERICDIITYIDKFQRVMSIIISFFDDDIFSEISIIEEQNEKEPGEKNLDILMKYISF